MANEQKDGGAVQDIEIFNVKASAENFRDTTDEFAKDVEDIQKIENLQSLTLHCVLYGNNHLQDFPILQSLTLPFN